MTYAASKFLISFYVILHVCITRDILLLLLLLKYSPPSGVFRTVWLVSVVCMVHKKITRLRALPVRVKSISSHYSGGVVCAAHLVETDRGLHSQLSPGAANSIGQWNPGRKIAGKQGFLRKGWHTFGCVLLMLQLVQLGSMLEGYLPDCWHICTPSPPCTGHVFFGEMATADGWAWLNDFSWNLPHTSSVCFHWIDKKLSYNCLTTVKIYL